MTAPVVLRPLAVTTIFVGGVAITPINGLVLGGMISNPSTPAGQGIGSIEVLYINITGVAAGLMETATTFPLQPGQTFTLPAGLTTSVSVNAATSGHRFSGFVIQPPTQFPPVPQTGFFPPANPTTMTAIIPSYLYQQYADDADLQAFVAAWNALAQSYATWFATVGLGVYTSPAIAGGLLDWVAQGVYGMTRPALASGRNLNLGPFNTYTLNSLAFNRLKKVGPTNVTVTTDDIFKRIMTWNFYKGDGNTFNIRWLKRRIMRFLLGVNGTAPNVDQTYIVSVTIGPGIIAILITTGTRKLTGGAIFGKMAFNSVAFNSLKSVFIAAPAQLPFEQILKEAMDSGVLQMPIQYQVVIKI